MKPYFGMLYLIFVGIVILAFQLTSRDTSSPRRARGVSATAEQTVADLPHLPPPSFIGPVPVPAAR